MNQYENGTLVIWQDLDKFAVGETDIAEAFTRKMELIREHLSLVFHRYLSGEPGLKKLDIRMNEQSVEPQDPFLIKKSTQLMDDEVIIVRGQKVRVKPYILPHTSKLTQKELKALGGKDGLRKNQGFYVYRNKRLLVWGNWFRLMRQGDLSKLARVQVDIPNSLDDLWTLDIKKSTATPPEEVKRNLSVIIQKISEGSKRTWTYRGKKETNDNIVHVWNRLITRDGNVLYEVNPDHPLVESIVSAHPEIQPQIEALLKQIGMSLPINSLYIDLTNDEKMDNDSDNKGTEVITLLKNVVSTYSGEDKEGFINDVFSATKCDNLRLVRQCLYDYSELYEKLYYNMKSINGYSIDEIRDKRLKLEGVLVPCTNQFNIDLLKQGGFSKVDIFWKDLNFVGYIAMK